MQFSEQFLYHIWDAQHLLDQLKCVSGKSVKINYPGRWNTDSGADFKDAILEIEGKTIKGDIEIDLTSYNWRSHAHNENPEFNNVILHVIYEDNGKQPVTVSENGSIIEKLEIKDQLDEDIGKLVEHYGIKPYTETDKDCNLFKNEDLDNTKQLLFKSGIERFESKVKRFSAEHYFSSFDQLLYMGLMEAMGYSKNKFQMLQIALKFPYEDLKKYYDSGMTEEEFISLLICSNDLKNHIPKKINETFHSSLLTVYNKQQFVDHKVDIKWKLFRIRPVNHPVIRILQVSHLIYNSFETSIFKEILKLFSVQADKFKLIDFKKNLYRTFYNENKILSEKHQLGKARIDTILINIILPLTVVYAREKNYIELEKAALNIYTKYPGLPSNYITNYMDIFLGTEQKKLVNKKAIHQQGMLNIYYKNCQHHYCDACEYLKNEKGQR